MSTFNITNQNIKKNYITNKKKKHNKILKKSTFSKVSQNTLKLKNFSIILHNNCNFAIMSNCTNKKKILKIYNSVYYAYLIIPKFNIYISFIKNLNIINITGHRLSSYYILFLKNFTNVLTTFNAFFYKKIKFKGKGYYIYKNKRNVIAPQFGYSHRIYVYSHFNIIKFLTKTKFIIFGLNKNDVISNSLNIKCKRPINIFTGRGLRFSSEIIYKKIGKVSSYR